MSCDCVKYKNRQTNLLLQAEKARDAWEANAEALAEDRDTWRERAEKAEQERDEAHARIEAVRDVLATHERLYGDTLGIPADRIRARLDLPTPKRPDGAEEIEAELIAFEETEQAHTMQARADFLAERGVRVEDGGDR